MNSLNIINDFNMFVYNDHTQSTTDCEGRVAVGNNATYSNYSIGSNLTLSTTRFDLIVNGKINILNGSNFNGNSAISQASNIINYTMTNNNGQLPQPKIISPINFTEYKNLYNCISRKSLNLTPNGTAKVTYGKLTLKGTDVQTNVFLINGDNIEGSGLSLGQLNGLDIVCPLGSTIIINVQGLNLNFGSYQIFRNGLTASKSDGQYILWNLYEATTLTPCTTSVKGSLLAPLASYNSGYSNIDGNLILYNLSGFIEAHYVPFLGQFPFTCDETYLIDVQKTIDKPNECYFSGDKILFTITITNIDTKPLLGLVFKDNLDLQTTGVIENNYIINTTKGTIVSNVNPIVISSIDLAVNESCIITIEATIA